jgi:hypothetical protein
MDTLCGLIQSTSDFTSSTLSVFLSNNEDNKSDSKNPDKTKIDKENELSKCRSFSILEINVILSMNLKIGKRLRDLDNNVPRARGYSVASVVHG